MINAPATHTPTTRSDRHGRLVQFGGSILACIALLAPSSVLAQQGARISIEPRAGLLWIRQGDSGGLDFSGAPGRFGALQLAVALTPRLRATASAGYGRLGDWYTGTLYRDNGDVLVDTHRYEVVPVIAGAELDVAGSRTVLSLGLQAGLVWERSLVTNRTGPPPFDTDTDARSRLWNMELAFSPGVTVRHPLSNTTAISIGVQSLAGESRFFREPILTAGLRWSIR